jgi:hypothetical protein
MMWGPSWRDEKEKIRVQSLRKLVEILEFCKQEHLKYKKSYALQKFLDSALWGWFPADPDEVAARFNMSRRTAQDYLLAIKAIACLLLEGVKREDEWEEEEWEEEVRA